MTSHRVIAIALAAILGSAGLVLFFSDIHPGGSFASRLVTQIGLAFFGGLALGHLLRNWRDLLPACLLAAWGAIVMGTIFLALGEPRGSWVAVSALAAVLVGGLIANVWTRARTRNAANEG